MPKDKPAIKPNQPDTKLVVLPVLRPSQLGQLPDIIRWLAQHKEQSIATGQWFELPSVQDVLESKASSQPMNNNLSNVSEYKWLLQTFDFDDESAFIHDLYSVKKTTGSQTREKNQERQAFLSELHNHINQLTWQVRQEECQSRLNASTDSAEGDLKSKDQSTKDDSLYQPDQIANNDEEPDWLREAVAQLDQSIDQAWHNEKRFIDVQVSSWREKKTWLHRLKNIGSQLLELNAEIESINPSDSGDQDKQADHDFLSDQLLSLPESWESTVRQSEILIKNLGMKESVIKTLTATKIINELQAGEWSEKNLTDLKNRLDFLNKKLKLWKDCDEVSQDLEKQQGSVQAIGDLLAKQPKDSNQTTAKKTDDYLEVLGSWENSVDQGLAQVNAIKRQLLGQPSRSQSVSTGDDEAAISVSTFLKAVNDQWSAKGDQSDAGLSQSNLEALRQCQTILSEVKSRQSLEIADDSIKDLVENANQLVKPIIDDTKDKRAAVERENIETIKERLSAIKNRVASRKIQSTFRERMENKQQQQRSTIKIQSAFRKFEVVKYKQSNDYRIRLHTLNLAKANVAKVLEKGDIDDQDELGLDESLNNLQTCFEQLITRAGLSDELKAKFDSLNTEVSERIKKINQSLIGFYKNNLQADYENMVHDVEQFKADAIKQGMDKNDPAFDYLNQQLRHLQESVNEFKPGISIREQLAITESLMNRKTTIANEIAKLKLAQELNDYQIFADNIASQSQVLSELIQKAKVSLDEINNDHSVDAEALSIKIDAFTQQHIDPIQAEVLKLSRQSMADDQQRVLQLAREDKVDKKHKPSKRQQPLSSDKNVSTDQPSMPNQVLDDANPTEVDTLNVLESVKRVAEAIEDLQSKLDAYQEAFTSTSDDSDADKADNQFRLELIKQARQALTEVDQNDLAKLSSQEQTNQLAKFTDKYINPLQQAIDKKAEKNIVKPNPLADGRSSREDKVEAFIQGLDQRLNTMDQDLATFEFFKPDGLSIEETRVVNQARSLIEKSKKDLLNLSADSQQRQKFYTEQKPAMELLINVLRRLTGLRMEYGDVDLHQNDLSPDPIVSNPKDLSEELEESKHDSGIDDESSLIEQPLEALLTRFILTKSEAIKTFDKITEPSNEQIMTWSNEFVLDQLESMDKTPIKTQTDYIKLLKITRLLNQMSKEFLLSADASESNAILDQIQQMNSLVGSILKAFPTHDSSSTQIQEQSKSKHFAVDPIAKTTIQFQLDYLVKMWESKAKQLADPSRKLASESINHDSSMATAGPVDEQLSSFLSVLGTNTDLAEFLVTQPQQVGARQSLINQPSDNEVLSQSMINNPELSRLHQMATLLNVLESGLLAYTNVAVSDGLNQSLLKLKQQITQTQLQIQQLIKKISESSEANEPTMSRWQAQIDELYQTLKSSFKTYEALLKQLPNIKPRENSVEVEVFNELTPQVYQKLSVQKQKYWDRLKIIKQTVSSESKKIKKILQDYHDHEQDLSNENPSVKAEMDLKDANYEVMLDQLKSYEKTLMLCSHLFLADTNSAVELMNQVMEGVFALDSELFQANDPSKANSSTVEPSAHEDFFEGLPSPKLSENVKLDPNIMGDFLDSVWEELNQQANGTDGSVTEQNESDDTQLTPTKNQELIMPTEDTGPAQSGNTAEPMVVTGASSPVVLTTKGQVVAPRRLMVSVLGAMGYTLPKSLPGSDLGFRLDQWQPKLTSKSSDPLMLWSPAISQPENQSTLVSSGSQGVVEGSLHMPSNGSLTVLSLDAEALKQPVLVLYPIFDAATGQLMISDDQLKQLPPLVKQLLQSLMTEVDQNWCINLQSLGGGLTLAMAYQYWMAMATDPANADVLGLSMLSDSSIQTLISQSDLDGPDLFSDPSVLPDNFVSDPSSQSGLPRTLTFTPLNATASPEQSTTVESEYVPPKGTPPTPGVPTPSPSPKNVDLLGVPHGLSDGGFRPEPRGKLFWLASTPRETRAKVFAWPGVADAFQEVSSVLSVARTMSDLGSNLPGMPMSNALTGSDSDVPLDDDHRLSSIQGQKVLDPAQVKDSFNACGLAQNKDGRWSMSLGMTQALMQKILVLVKSNQSGTLVVTSHQQSAQALLKWLRSQSFEIQAGRISLDQEHLAGFLALPAGSQQLLVQALDACIQDNPKLILGNQTKGALEVGDFDESGYTLTLQQPGVGGAVEKPWVDITLVASFRGITFAARPSLTASDKIAELVASSEISTVDQSPRPLLPDRLNAGGYRLSRPQVLLTAVERSGLALLGLPNSDDQQLSSPLDDIPPTPMSPMPSSDPLPVLDQTQSFGIAGGYSKQDQEKMQDARERKVNAALKKVKKTKKKKAATQNLSDLQQSLASGQSIESSVLIGRSKNEDLVIQSPLLLAYLLTAKPVDSPQQGQSSEDPINLLSESSVMLLRGPNPVIDASKNPRQSSSSMPIALDLAGSFPLQIRQKSFTNQSSQVADISSTLAMSLFEVSLAEAEFEKIPRVIRLMMQAALPLDTREGRVSLLLTPENLLALTFIADQLRGDGLPRLLTPDELEELQVSRSDALIHGESPIILDTGDLLPFTRQQTVPGYSDFSWGIVWGQMPGLLMVACLLTTLSDPDQQALVPHDQLGTSIKFLQSGDAKISPHHLWLPLNRFDSVSLSDSSQLGEGESSRIPEMSLLGKATLSDQLPVIDGRVGMPLRMMVSTDPQQRLAWVKRLQQAMPRANKPDELALRGDPSQVFIPEPQGLGFLRRLDGHFSVADFQGAATDFIEKKRLLLGFLLLSQQDQMPDMRFDRMQLPGWLLPMLGSQPIGSQRLRSQPPVGINMTQTYSGVHWQSFDESESQSPVVTVINHGLSVLSLFCMIHALSRGVSLVDGVAGQPGSSPNLRLMNGREGVVVTSDRLIHWAPCLEHLELSSIPRSLEGGLILTGRVVRETLADVAGMGLLIQGLHQIFRNLGNRDSLRLLLGNRQTGDLSLLQESTMSEEGKTAREAVVQTELIASLNPDILEQALSLQSRVLGKELAMAKLQAAFYRWLANTRSASGLMYNGHEDQQDHIVLQKSISVQEQISQCQAGIFELHQQINAASNELTEHLAIEAQREQQLAVTHARLADVESRLAVVTEHTSHGEQGLSSLQALTQASAEELQRLNEQQQSVVGQIREMEAALSSRLTELKRDLDSGLDQRRALAEHITQLQDLESEQLGAIHANHEALEALKRQQAELQDAIAASRDTLTQLETQQAERQAGAVTPGQYGDPKGHTRGLTRGGSSRVSPLAEGLGSPRGVGTISMPPSVPEGGLLSQPGLGDGVGHPLRGSQRGARRGAQRGGSHQPAPAPASPDSPLRHPSIIQWQNTWRQLAAGSSAGVVGGDDHVIEKPRATIYAPTESSTPWQKQGDDNRWQYQDQQTFITKKDDGAITIDYQGMTDAEAGKQAMAAWLYTHAWQGALPNISGSREFMEAAFGELTRVIKIQSLMHNNTADNEDLKTTQNDQKIESLRAQFEQRIATAHAQSSARTETDPRPDSEDSPHPGPGNLS